MRQFLHAPISVTLKESATILTHRFICVEIYKSGMAPGMLLLNHGGDFRETGYLNTFDCDSFRQWRGRSCRC